MKQTATMGNNRTGVDTSEGRVDDMQKSSQQFEPSSHGTTAGAGKVRVLYAKEADKKGLGSVPPPNGNGKGKLKAGAKKLTGAEPTLLMDKVGERLAFERSGTRLYEALVSKHEAFGSFDGGPSRAELIDILNEEHRHFIVLEQAMRKMGGDPTAITPSADVAATAAAGVMKVIVDPRTSLLQSLEAILIAELTDNACWDELGAIAKRGGEDALAKLAAEAHRTEQEHLTKVKSWIRAGHGVGA